MHPWDLWTSPDLGQCVDEKRAKSAEKLVPTHKRAEEKWSERILIFMNVTCLNKALWVKESYLWFFFLPSAINFKEEEGFLFSFLLEKCVISINFWKPRNKSLTDRKCMRNKGSDSVLFKIFLSCMNLIASFQISRI